MSHGYYDGIEDDRHDTWRQRLLEARIDGREAGRKSQSAEMNPYYTFEPEFNEWHHGRLEGLAENITRVALSAAPTRRVA